MNQEIPDLVQDVLSALSPVVEPLYMDIMEKLNNIELKVDLISSRINNNCSDSGVQIVDKKDPRLHYDIASFIYGNDNSCTILSKAWTSEEVDAKIALHKANGCNHFVIDALNSNNWSEDSLPDYWAGVRRQDVHVDDNAEDTQRCIDILFKIRDAGMTIAAYHANDGRNDINNESVWTDSHLDNYWRRFMKTVATSKYKDGSSLVKEIIFKREFDDAAERSIDSVIHMLRVIRSEMAIDQTLWTHNEGSDRRKLIEVFPFIDGLRIQAGGDNGDHMIANNRYISDLCVEHNKLFKFAEYPVNGVFDGFSHPEYGDALLELGKPHNSLFRGVDMYCTLPIDNKETQPDQYGFQWSNVDFTEQSFSVVKDFKEDSSLLDIDFRWADTYHGGNYTWYGDISVIGTDWDGYKPYEEGNVVYGNIWIIVPQENGRYIAAPFEGYTNQLTLHVFGNLNFEYTNILTGALSSPWQPSPGQRYGWMISTNVIYPGQNGKFRTNILWKEWPV